LTFKNYSTLDGLPDNVAHQIIQSRDGSLWCGTAKAEVRFNDNTHFSNDPIMSDYLQYGFCGVLPKPYSLDDFSRVLQQALHPSRKT